MDGDDRLSYLDRIVRGDLASRDLGESGWLTRENVFRAAILGGIVFLAYPLWSAVLGWLGLDLPEEGQILVAVAVAFAWAILAAAWSLKRWRG